MTSTLRSISLLFVASILAPGAHAGHRVGLPLHSAHLSALQSQDRRAKCRVVWQASAPWSYSPGLADFFVGEHERRGIGPEWWYSLVYGKGNFGLTIGKRAPGLCYGPLDVKWPGMAREVGARCPNDLRNPRLNIKAHCAEMAYYHRKTGREGFALLATVFYPASPREYSRWRPVEKQHRAILAKWQAKQR